MDGVTCVIHVLFWLILSMPFLMWITLLGIRVPRMVLNFLSTREQKSGDGTTKFQNYEFLFRYYTTLGYFPIGWLFQLITCLAWYCRDWTSQSTGRMLLRMLQGENDFDDELEDAWPTEEPGEVPAEVAPIVPV